jgi:hypothetical protein
VSLPASNGHVVAKSNTNPIPKKRAGIRPAPVPWPQTVNGADLLDELTKVFTRYLVLPKGAAEAIALWALFTHAFEAFDVSPRLALLSPVPECGKTSLLTLLSYLVLKALAASHVSPAVIFRVIQQECPTLLLDEADTYIEGRTDYTGILNSGHTRGAAVIVRARKSGDDYEPMTYSTWAPIVIAKIGKLSATLASRSIIIPMRRKRPNETVTRFRQSQDAAPLDELASKCARWAKDHVAALKGTDPPIPAGLNNRTADNWRPLFAIAELVRGDWPNKAQTAAFALANDESEITEREQLLVDIANIQKAVGGDRIASQELCIKLNQLSDRTWGAHNNGRGLTQNGLSNLLSGFLIKPKTIRIGSDTPRGYMWADFEDAFERYLPANRNTATSTAN